MKALLIYVVLTGKDLYAAFVRCTKEYAKQHGKNEIPVFLPDDEPNPNGPNQTKFAGVVQEFWRVCHKLDARGSHEANSLSIVYHAKVEGDKIVHLEQPYHSDTGRPYEYKGYKEASNPEHRVRDRVLEYHISCKEAHSNVSEHARKVQKKLSKVSKQLETVS